MKVRAKLLVYVGIIVLLAFGVTISFVSVSARKITDNLGEDMAAQMAYRYGAEVKGDLEVAMDAARTLAHMFEGIKENKNPDRKVMDDILRKVLENNRDFLGVWTCWEPDALDGKDKEYVNAPGHDSTGRYIPYWNRAGGSIALEPLVDYETSDGSGYYLPVKRSGLESIMEPYLYKIGGKDVLLTSVVVPVNVGGRFLGVAGIDLALDSFQELTEKIKPFETGYAFLMSNSAIMVAHPDASSIGKDAGDRQPEEIRQVFKDAVQSGKEYSYYKKSIVKGTKNFFVVTPITIGETKTPWSFAVSIPNEKLQESSRNLTFSIITIGAATLVLFGFVMFIVSSSIVKPLKLVVNGLKDIAEGEGDLTKRLNIKRNDEIGELASWFDKFMENLQKVIRSSVDNTVRLKSSSSDLLNIASTLAKGTEQSSALAANVSHATENMNRNRIVVSDAMEGSASGIAMVATSSEQMASTINEITKNSERARGISEKALAEAKETSASMNELGRAATDISKVTESINEISDQTNLLALNATIEAARAGEAGKGFAVVANEIKDLAGQTAAATHDIKEKIDTIQATTNGSIERINSITAVVEDIHNIITMIAAAVEEQSVTTSEISSNILRVSKSVQNANQSVGESAKVSLGISRDIEKVSHSASEGAASAASLKNQAEQLGLIAHQLQAILGKFRIS